MKKNEIISEGYGNINLQDLSISGDLSINQIDIDELTRKITKPKDDEIVLLREQISVYKENKDLNDEKLLNLRRELSEKLNEKIDVEEQVKKLAKELSGKDISASGTLYREAVELFLQGKLDDALDVLDDSKLEAEAKKNSNARILKANFLTLRHKFDEAEKNYLRAIEMYPDCNSFYKAADFYYYLKKYPKAKEKIEKAYSYSENQEERASCIGLLGLINFSMLEFKEAEKNYQEALVIRRRLAMENPQSFSWDLAIILNNLAVLQRRKNEFKESEKNLKEALEIQRKLAETTLSLSYRMLQILSITLLYYNIVRMKLKSQRKIIKKH